MEMTQAHSLLSLAGKGARRADEGAYATGCVMVAAGAPSPQPLSRKRERGFFSRQGDDATSFPYPARGRRCLQGGCGETKHARATDPNVSLYPGSCSNEWNRLGSIRCLRIYSKNARRSFFA